jgi:predicted molibdopterin-dependent oxidoreductase YjgC
MSDKGGPQLQRLAESGRATVRFLLDGRPCKALAGDTVLTALLMQGAQLRRSEFSGAPRAGFCLMGACQDCWVVVEGRGRVRACATMAEDGMEIRRG